MISNYNADNDFCRLYLFRFGLLYYSIWYVPLYQLWLISFLRIVNSIFNYNADNGYWNKCFFFITSCYKFIHDKIEYNFCMTVIVFKAWNLLEVLCNSELLTSCILCIVFSFSNQIRKLMEVLVIATLTEAWIC